MGFLILLVLAGTGLFTSTTAVQPPKPQTNTAQRNTEKTVCKNDTPTGSRFRKKSCMTKVEYEQMVERARREIEEAAMRSPLNAE